VETLLIIIFALLGAAIGSFLNVCIDRLPAGKSLISPPSYCDVCQRRLSPLDMVPIVSYLVLRGRCRYCQAPIPRRVLWVELISTALITFLYWQYGMTAQLAVNIYYFCLFLTIAVIDLEHKLILNKIVYPSMLIVVIIDILIPPPALSKAFTGDATVLNGIIHSGTILNGILGGATGFVVLLIPALVFSGGMGWGDVKMAALIGLATGFPHIFVALVMAIILGGLVAASLLLLKIRKRKDAIPFGPFLSLATIAIILWGQTILNWYLGFFSF
jgi:leader peptidase (prepilin peptidase)/N-methyltransferase